MIDWLLGHARRAVPKPVTVPRQRFGGFPDRAKHADCEGKHADCELTNVERFFTGLELVSPHAPDGQGSLYYAGDWEAEDPPRPTAMAHGGSTARWAGSR